LAEIITMMENQNNRFSSRFTFLLSALGIAVGTGNIWRFPRIVASNAGDDGAGAFLVAWITFLFLWSIPLIIVEYIMGRQSRMGTVGAFSNFMGKPFAFLGGFVGVVSTAIAFFYSVIVGWNIYYFSAIIFTDLPQNNDASWALWSAFQNSSFPIIFHAIAMTIGGLAIFKGVSSIEKVNKILIPVLLGIVLLSVFRAVSLPGSLDGIAYLFTPDWSQLRRPDIWVDALAQNAFDTGAGFGLFLTYAIYIRKKYGIVKNAFTTAIGNNFVSLIAAIMIFSTVFSILGNEMGMQKSEILDVMKTSGPAATGLTFIWMPQLFAKMAFGKPLAILFFLGLSFAGFSSLISMLELAVRNLIDFGVQRSSAVLWIVFSSFLLGIPSAMSLEILGNQDFVWSVGLIISGILMAIAAIKYGIYKMMNEVSLESEDDWPFPRWWPLVVKFIAPLVGFTLVAWWMIESPSFFVTCVVQWGTVLAFFYIMNNYLTKKLSNKLSSE
jgi:NSS family neurotransmitter:Na+ symporter